MIAGDDRKKRDVSARKTSEPPLGYCYQQLMSSVELKDSQSYKFRKEIGCVPEPFRPAVPE